MWDIVKTLLEKLPQLRSREERIEDKAKHRLVFLHEAFCEYHAAYRAYSTERTVFDYYRWMQAMDWLAHVLEGIGVVVAVSDPQLFDCIQHYLDETSPGQMRKSTPSDSDAEFRCAINGLRKFIKEQMTIGEILKAQQTYQKERFRSN